VPTPSKTTTDTPQRRQPIKRQKVGGVTISIIRDGAAFMVIAHHPSGRRTRERHATLAEASTAFALKTAAVGRDGIEVAGAAESGDLRAIHEFRAATADWPTKPSVETALRAYVESQRLLKVSGTVSEAIDARIEDAHRRKLSMSHQTDLKMRLGRFARAFGTRSLASVTTTEITSWIYSEAKHPKTMLNLRLAVSSIFAPARESGQIAHNPVPAVKLPKIISGPPGTITAAQLAALLEAAPERSRAAIVVQALAGLRLAEVNRLNWEDVSLLHQLITISEGAAKTATRRLVPICAALAEWLAPLHKGTGKVSAGKNLLRDDFVKTRRKAGCTPWPHNALRHTAASAWCAVEHDIARVAGWCGNSPTEIHRSYRALLTHEQASAWLQVRPTSSPSTGTVLPFQVAG
jgi:integrase